MYQCGSSRSSTCGRSAPRERPEDKSFHVVEGANHMEMYDGQKEVAEAVGKLGPFFADKL